ncbi:hypothetical protein ACOCEA_11210 [Maribacter sp. CXY002]|uniref:hypothetical protein n=1 Tax=Maribacter luteocoastalis TaxID=3407671 RepID=UPI003B685433
MIKNLLSLIFIFQLTFAMAQDDGRVLLRGEVLYKNVSVANEYVINSTTEQATVTNKDGEFAIAVKVGDELVFTAVNYQYEMVKITPEILAKNRLVVAVNEKVTELDEVVVTPEDQERYLQVKNEEFKEYEYEVDRGTEVENIALSRAERGMTDGINFANIFRAIFKAKDTAAEEGPKLLVSDVLRQVYDDQFFVVDLQIPQDKINTFLLYCDERMPTRSLLKKENEFQLIDNLVNLSKSFRKELNEE